ncbi:hypothetical protein HYY75_12160 [bacterium]|nr:hypothetical protein [bacterium]
MRSLLYLELGKPGYKTVNYLGRRGMAIPMSLLFVTVAITLLFSMTTSRTTVKKQNLSSYTQKKAYYMAMGGIQHALLKLRVLPREAYQAGALARGICPFFSTFGNQQVSTETPILYKNNVAMDIFMSDLHSSSPPGGPGGVPLSFNFKQGETGWGYKITKFTVSNYYTETQGTEAGTVYQVCHIEAMGYANDPRDSIASRTEFVSKQVKLERKIN